MLEGVVEDNVAFPPERDKVKSFACKLPLPLLVLNTASEKLRETELLSKAIWVCVIVGARIPSITIFLTLARDDPPPCEGSVWLFIYHPLP